MILMEGLLCSTVIWSMAEPYQTAQELNMPLWKLMSPRLSPNCLVITIMFRQNNVINFSGVRNSNAAIAKRSSTIHGGWNLKLPPLASSPGKEDCSMFQRLVWRAICRAKRIQISPSLSAKTCCHRSLESEVWLQTKLMRQHIDYSKETATHLCCPGISRCD